MVSSVPPFPETNPVLGKPLERFTSGFGMRPGLPSPLWPPTNVNVGLRYLKEIKI